MSKYTYICKVSTNWVGVEEIFDLVWMTKDMFESNKYDDDIIQSEVVQELGLEYEVVDDGRSYDEPALLRTSLSFFGCEMEEELCDTFGESQSQDYENEAIEQQGISWEVIEIDNLKNLRKEKLDKLKNII